MPRLRVPVTDRDHVRGPARASVTLVEYGDFQCPFCGAAYWVLRDLEDRFGRDFRFVYRHFPLAEIHPYAMIAAESAEAAGAQDKFWDMHDMLFQNQPYFELENLIAYANAIGLDIDAFTSDLEMHRHIPKIREDFMGGARSGVNGTPTLFINGERFDSPADEALLARAIDAARRHRHVEATP
jgi:protein-disulfide isomerase